MLDVTDATFEAEVLASEQPVLVEFTAPWCRPCKAIEPFLVEIGREHEGRLRLGAARHRRQSGRALTLRRALPADRDRLLVRRAGRGDPRSAAAAAVRGGSRARSAGVASRARRLRSRRWAIPRPAEELLDAIRSRDGARIASCFAPDAELRALTPHRLREEDGPAAIAAQYAHWLEPLESFAVVAGDVTAVADRIGLRYRFRERDPAKVWQENEHTAYTAVVDGRVASRGPHVRGVPVGGAAGLTTTETWDALLDAAEVAHRGSEPARPGRTVPLPPDLHPSVAEALAGRGVTELYLHQAETWEAAARGESVVVTTGTASGKSLAFSLPVLDAIAREPAARALFLYPTKALAQDQARWLAGLGLRGLRPAIYDGDTPIDQRAHIRRSANAILTNPDMLHIGVLPHHDRWGDVLHNLQVVVVDEAHVYRGVFGSHVANVLRRLRRLALAYGAEPLFVLASATIANAGELASRLTGLEVRVVDHDTAPRADREIVLWNPELVDVELGIRASPLGDASRLLAGLVDRGLRTICFTKSRKAAELVHRFASDRVDAATARRLAPYRAGYTPEQRRDIERRLVDGELLGVTATDALELGIDIGSLDCAISVGFPGTVASLRQQWGRAGRRTRGLAVLIASEDGLDQFFVAEPEALLGRRVEAALIDPATPRILDGHVLSAAYEGPLTPADAEVLGPEALERAAVLPELEATSAGYVWRGRDTPAARLSLRSGDAEAFVIVDEETGTVLGTAERERAFSTVHEGAVYLHLGDQYGVTTLDLETRTAYWSGPWPWTGTRSRARRPRPRSSSPSAAGPWRESSSTTAGSTSPSRSSPSSARRSPTAA